MLLKLRWLLHLILLSALFGATTHAATITAASCSTADVQAAINAASDGDTVIVPNGSCTWSSGIATTKQIKIQGQTAGQTHLTLSGAGTMFTITPGPNFSTEISNIDFLPGSATGNYIFVGGSPTAKPPLIHHNTFTIPDFQLVNAIDWERYRGGVIHHNTFSSSNPSGTQSTVIHMTDLSNANLSWTTASTLGTADTDGTRNVYIEDNTFNNTYKTSIDCDNGMRIVVRHNTFNNSAFGCHMADSSTFGVRHTETYNNTFIFSTTPAGGVNYPLNLSNGWMDRIGGTGVFTQNVVPNIISQAWGDKPEMELIVQNLHRNAGPFPCVANYPAPHQLGQSNDGTKVVTDPYYIWGNTGSGAALIPQFADYTPDECGRDYVNWTTANWEQAGRDYVVGTPRPGWAPYTYPHPLTQGTTSPPPAGPSAPTSLTTTVK